MMAMCVCLTQTRQGELAQYMEAQSGWSTESASADFHALRRDFSPPIRFEQNRQHGAGHD